MIVSGLVGVEAPLKKSPLVHTLDLCGEFWGQKGRKGVKKRR